MSTDLSFQELKEMFQAFTTQELLTFRKRKITEMDDEEFKVFLRSRCIADFELGVRQKFWEDFTEKEPIPFPKVFKMEDFPEGATTAHLVVKLGIFPSVTQARKNGFNNNLTMGLHSFKKGLVRAIIQ